MVRTSLRSQAGSVRESPKFCECLEVPKYLLSLNPENYIKVPKTT